MTTVKAAELPEGSVVANKVTVWIKNNPSEWSQWTGTTGGHYSNTHLQEAIDAGAVVLREGPT